MEERGKMKKRHERWRVYRAGPRVLVALKKLVYGGGDPIAGP